MLCVPEHSILRVPSDSQSETYHLNEPVGLALSVKTRNKGAHI
jgi:hypothetical protein